MCGESAEKYRLLIAASTGRFRTATPARLPEQFWNKPISHRQFLGSNHRPFLALRSVGSAQYECGNSVESHGYSPECRLLKRLVVHQHTGICRLAAIAGASNR